MFAAISTFAQTVATVSGYVLNIANGNPVQSQLVYVFADYTMNTNGFNYYNQVYTDANGLYIDTIPLDDGIGGYYTQGNIEVGVYDCSYQYTSSLVSFTTGIYDLHANFNICCISNCYANFSSTADTSNILVVNFFDNSASSDSINARSWDFGDGSTSSLTNPVHTYLVYGEYNVCLTISSTSGCSNTYCEYISVAPYCNATFYYTANSAYNYQFNYYGGAVNTLLWDFGDSTTSHIRNPNHIFPNSGFYYVCLTVSDLDSSGTAICTDNYCENISVNIPSTNDYYCDANFYYNQTSYGTFSFNDYSFANTDSLDVIVSWKWNFGDGTTSGSQYPSHTYSQPGVYNVDLTIFTAEGCSSYLEMPVEVDTIACGSCQSDFEVYIDYSLPFTYYFEEASLTENPSQLIATYFWDFGDGATSTAHNPLHTFTQGVYHICHTITTTTGCSSTYCENLVVDSTCYMYLIAISIINESTAGAADGAIAISVIGTSPFQFNWSNGATTQNIYGLSSGYYNVWVTDANGCQTWATFDILVNADSSNWNYSDTLISNVIDTCFNFHPDSASIYNYSFHGNDTVTITWIVFDITGTLHGFITTNYLYDTTAYHIVLLSISCDSSKNRFYQFYDKIYIRGNFAGISPINISDDNVILFPIPVADKLNISFNLPKPNIITINILNATGQLIYGEKTIYSGGQKVLTVNTSSFARGLYFVQLNYNGQNLMRRFVK